ncbi:MAG: DUF1223 domain-containing protein [Gammaproteobacteria bacterium]|nr:DUF1223 domain-containing protein [Gammaproteobacteria bacterium]
MERLHVHVFIRYSGISHGQVDDGDSMTEKRAHYFGLPGLCGAWFLALLTPVSFADNNDLAVVELFTSQGCYSCPPAEAFLRELALEEPQVLALEFHVDYWDDLVYGSAGKWKDPFSDPSFTLRQRGYNQRALDGRRGVYTPQMIINGQRAEVGSKRAQIASLLDRAAPQKPLNVHVARTDTGMLVTITGSEDGEAGIWLVRFDREHKTSVNAGENQGKTLLSKNVVRELRQVGEWRGMEVSISVEVMLNPDQGCAVLVQSAAPGPVLGAGRCPDV